MKPILIYCAGKNKRLEDIAVEEGYKIGVRLPNTVYHPVYFSDQDWKKPNRIAYMDAVRFHRPVMATVMDWEHESQFSEVLSWAEEISDFVEQILVVPKVLGSINKIPLKVNNKDIVLAYSVPTQYGGTQIPFWEFSGRKVHLLGGSPFSQYETYMYMQPIADVISMDGNYHQMKAMRFCEHWEYPNKWIPDGGKTTRDAHYSAFQKSCHNIMEFWKKEEVRNERNRSA